MVVLSSVLIIGFILYKRHFPVLGVHSIYLKDLNRDKIKIVDLRDYNEAYNDSPKGAINIPIAYLKKKLPRNSEW